MSRRWMVAPIWRARTAAAWLAAVLVGALSSSGARADSLSDGQLYFDPDSISPSLYPRVELSTVGSTQWSSLPGRTIVGANILPVLKAGDYPPGYVFSQSDYDVQPNVHYSADLTAGTLTGNFQQTGIYHVRLQYSDSTSEINTVLVDAGLGQEDQANPMAAIRRVPQPRGNKVPDLYVVSTGLANDGFINAARANLVAGGKTIADASTIAQVRAAIQNRSNDLGRRVNVVMVGHGRPGSIRFGTAANGERINNDNDGVVTPAMFNTQVGGFAKSLTLFSCSVGQGGAGQTFLEDLGGNNIMAGAWDDTVYSWGGGGWGVQRPARFTKIPEPAALLLLVIGALAARRRCRV